MARTKIKVALLVGGTSPEREVSKMSGKSVYEALIKLGYPTVIVDPAYGTNQPKNPEDFFSEKDFGKISNYNCITSINSNLFDDIDIVFSALHGKWAEDGTIQSLLELRGLKYTGSKVLASALAMDKIMSKVLFEQFNVPTADWIKVESDKFGTNDIVKKIDDRFGFPCVVKPNDQGSTVGLSIVRQKEELEKAVKIAFNFSSKVLIEKYIEGRELTVAVLDGVALPVLEIIPKSGFYDYESKYTKGKSEYIVPAEIPENVFQNAQQLALSAFNALGCEGYGRVDFRLNKDNKPYCLEVNTLPGMTSTSLVPKMAKAVGISFEDLVEKIIIQAL